MIGKTRYIVRSDGVRQRYHVKRLRPSLDYNRHVRAWITEDTLKSYNERKEHHPLTFTQFKETGKELRGKVRSVLVGNGFNGKLEVAYEKRRDIIVVQSKPSSEKMRIKARRYSPTAKLEARFEWDEESGEYKILSYYLDGKDREDLAEAVEGI